MCGRFTLHHSIEKIAQRFLVPAFSLPFGPRYNIAPSQNITAIIQTDQREFADFKWGLLPFWAKDPKIGNKLINAAPSTAPRRLPSPPMTTMRTSSIDRMRVNASGVRYFVWCANSEPANPVTPADTENAMTLTRPTGMPKEYEAASESRTPKKARPIPERNRLISPSRTSNKTIKQR